MTHLTERQAWETIVEAYATRWKDRSRQQIMIALHDLCVAVDTLWDLCKINDDVCESMNEEIKQHLEIVPGPVFCPVRMSGLHSRGFQSKHDHLRADFCNLMAFSCEEE